MANICKSQNQSVKTKADFNHPTLIGKSRSKLKADFRANMNKIRKRKWEFMHIHNYLLAGFDIKTHNHLILHNALLILNDPRVHPVVKLTSFSTIYNIKMLLTYCIHASIIKVIIIRV